MTGVPAGFAATESSRLRLLTLPVAALLLPLMAVIIGGWNTWRSVQLGAATDLTRTATIGADYTARTLTAYVSALDRLNDTLVDRDDDNIRAHEAAINASFHRLLTDLPLARTGYVGDRTGHPLASATVYPVPRGAILAAFSEFFVALSQPDPPKLHVSQIYTSTVDGKPFFALGERRRRTGNGQTHDEFDGLITISIAPAVLSTGLTRLRDDGGAIALVRADGLPLALPGADSAALHSITNRSDFLAHVRQSADNDLLVGPADDGTSRINSIRRVEGFPLYVIASRS